jgi:hypothetical protein
VSNGEHVSEQTVPADTQPAAENGTQRGGGSNARYPWRYAVYLSDRLHEAVQLAMDIEEEEAGHLIRRCLRDALMARGYLQPKGGI